MLGGYHPRLIHADTILSHITIASLQLHTLMTFTGPRKEKRDPCQDWLQLQCTAFVHDLAEGEDIYWDRTVSHAAFASQHGCQHHVTWHQWEGSIYPLSAVLRPSRLHTAGGRIASWTLPLVVAHTVCLESATHMVLNKAHITVIYAFHFPEIPFFAALRMRAQSSYDAWTLYVNASASRWHFFFGLGQSEDKYSKCSAWRPSERWLADSTAVPLVAKFNKRFDCCQWDSGSGNLPRSSSYGKPQSNCKYF